MFYIVNLLPFELYVLILICISGGLVFSIFDIRKKRPGHPAIWIIPFGMLECIFLLFYRCSLELSTNVVLQKVTNILSLIGIGLFFASLIITFIIAYKKNYINREKFKKLMPTFIAGIILMLLGGVMLLQNL